MSFSCCSSAWGTEVEGRPLSVRESNKASRLGFYVPGRYQKENNMGLLEDLETALHPVREAVAKAVADADAKTKAALATLSADVKGAAAAAVASLQNDAPELEAAAKEGAAVVEAAVKAYLESKGL